MRTYIVFIKSKNLICLETYINASFYHRLNISTPPGPKIPKLFSFGENPDHMPNSRFLRFIRSWFFQKTFSDLPKCLWSVMPNTFSCESCIISTKLQLSEVKWFPFPPLNPKTLIFWFNSFKSNSKLSSDRRFKSSSSSIVFSISPVIGLPIIK